jgi:hypothetical protein
MLSGVLHDGRVVFHQRLNRGIDLRRRVQPAKIALRERTLATRTLRATEQQVNVVLAPRDLVEEMDMMDVGAPVDKIMLVPWPNCPHKYLILS